ncbi:MAG: UDP-glucose 4-epimerase GalE [Brevinema sp.]
MNNVLVIGGAGYVGSHTIKLLKEKGYGVVVLDNLSKGYREALDCIDPTIPFFKGDLEDKVLLHKIFNQFNINTVMHFAAFIEVGTSVKDPALYYHNNLIKVFFLLEAMREAKINNFIFSSTAAIFGNPQYDLIDESHPQLPINPYGDSKLMVEHILRDFSYAYPEFNYTSFRYFNACGSDIDGKIGHSYSPATHLLTIMMEAATGQREQLNIFGTDYDTPDGTCIRDYIHVTDLAEAHILGMERMIDQKVSDVFNLGTGNGFSVYEMVTKAKEITGVDFKVVNADRREGDPAKLVANPAKANKILHWNAKYGLEDMIRTAWFWVNNKTY